MLVTVWAIFVTNIQKMSFTSKFSPQHQQIESLTLRTLHVVFIYALSGSDWASDPKPLNGTRLKKIQLIFWTDPISGHWRKSPMKIISLSNIDFNLTVHINIVCSANYEIKYSNSTFSTFDLRPIYFAKFSSDLAFANGEIWMIELISNRAELIAV